MTELHFYLRLNVDNETFITRHVSTFDDVTHAEEVMHSIERGVFDDDFVTYHVEKIVYELSEADCWDGTGEPYYLAD